MKNIVEMKEVRVSEVFDLVGHFGCIQVIYIIICTSIHLFSAFHMVLNIYTGMFIVFLYLVFDIS